MTTLLPTTVSSYITQTIVKTTRFRSFHRTENPHWRRKNFQLQKNPRINAYRAAKILAIVSWFCSNSQSTLWQTHAPLSLCPYFYWKHSKQHNTLIETFSIILRSISGSSLIQQWNHIERLGASEFNRDLNSSTSTTVLLYSVD